MIKALETNVGLASLFVLDTNIVQNGHLGKTHCNFLQAQAEHTVKPDGSDEGIKRIQELSYLLNNSKMIVPSEVREEIRDFHLILKKRIKSIEEGNHRFQEDERETVLSAMTKYLEDLHLFRSKIYELDPRERRFSHNPVFAIEKDEEYQKVLTRSEENLLQILKERKKFRGDGKDNLNDAAIFTVAYLLDKKGYKTCILSRDKDFFELARRAEDGVRVTTIDKTTRVVYNPLTEYTLTIFDPESSK